MAHLEDLTGRRFGALTVISRVAGTKRTTWHCKCDCGRETDVLAGSLKRGYTTSCGKCHMHRAELMRGRPSDKFRDLAGQRFGMLVAVSYDRARRRWICKCDCGGECSITTTYLTNGSRTDCGCKAAAAAGERIKAGSAGYRNGTNVNAIQHIMEGRKRSTNTSGVTGVKEVATVHSGIKYCAQIVVRGHSIYLGRFDTLEAAAAARKAAEEKYFAPLIRCEGGISDDNS